MNPWSEKRRRILGVMLGNIHTAIHSKSYAWMCLYGMKRGITVLFFTPGDIHWEKKKVAALTYGAASNQWTKGMFPLPDCVYDRCLNLDRAGRKRYVQTIRQFKKEGVYLLARCLPGKWEMYRILSANSELSGYIPKTRLYRHPKDIFLWLKRYGELILKPDRGWQGKGVIHIRKFPGNTFQVRGRNLRNQPFSREFSRPDSLLQWLGPLLEKRKYIIQSFLDLTSREGNVFDIRSFMQKQSNGCWTLLGLAVRRGGEESLTANLHGGATPENLDDFLLSQYGSNEAFHYKEQLIELSRKIPPLIEQVHGKLFELGIDFGIDKKGDIWILEINSKPGRTVLAACMGSRIERISLMHPVNYARHLLDWKLGG